MNRKFKIFCILLFNSLYIGYKIPLLPYSIYKIYNNMLIRIIRCLGGISFLMYITGGYILLSDSIINFVLCMVILHTINIILILICKVVHIYKIMVLKSVRKGSTINIYVIYLIVFFRIVSLLVLECIGILGVDINLYFEVCNHIHDIINCYKKKK